MSTCVCRPAQQVWLQTTSFCLLCYMSLATYSTLFRVNLGGFYRLMGPQLSAHASLLYNAEYLSRLQFSLGMFSSFYPNGFHTVFLLESFHSPFTLISIVMSSYLVQILHVRHMFAPDLLLEWFFLYVTCQTALLSCVLLGYNFLQCLHLSSASTPAFSNLMQHIDVIPVFGTSFLSYIPLVLLVGALVTLCDGLARLLNLLGIETEEAVVVRTSGGRCVVVSIEPLLHVRWCGFVSVLVACSSTCQCV